MITGLRLDKFGKLTELLRMLEICNLLALVDVYRAATGTEDRTVSSRVFSDGKKLSALRGGADITVSRFNDAVQWFSHNWPEKAVWPENIIRPSVAEVVQ